MGAFLNRMVEEQVVENFQQFLGKVKEFKDESKTKVADLEAEMAQMGAALDEKEQEINRLREQFEKQEGETDAWMAELDSEQR